MPATEERLKMKSQKIPNSSSEMGYLNVDTPDLPFVAARRGSTEQLKRSHLRQNAVAGIFGHEISIN
jgi:hypothetical protein